MDHNWWITRWSNWWITIDGRIDGSQLMDHNWWITIDGRIDGSQDGRIDGSQLMDHKMVELMDHNWWSNWWITRWSNWWMVTKWTAILWTSLMLEPIPGGIRGAHRHHKLIGLDRMEANPKRDDIVDRNARVVGMSEKSSFEPDSLWWAQRPQRGGMCTYVETLSHSPGCHIQRFTMTFNRKCCSEKVNFLY